MKTSLIITTYNRADALELVLKSVLVQSVVPNEIIIADDGSTGETKELVDSYSNKFSVPLIHIWQKDAGFRISKIRNAAIKKTSYEYIITIDGDMILHYKFIESHLKFAKKNCFIQGHRVLLKAQLTRKLIKSNSISVPFFGAGIKNGKNAIHNYTLAKVFTFKMNHIRGIKGCNYSFWKTDSILINGFNEDFEGWGKEDSEISVRFLNAGIKRIDVRFAAVAFHLDHQESNKHLDNPNYLRNLKLLKQAQTEKLTFCNNGLERK